MTMKRWMMRTRLGLRPQRAAECIAFGTILSFPCHHLHRPLHFPRLIRNMYFYATHLAPHQFSSFFLLSALCSESLLRSKTTKMVYCCVLIVLRAFKESGRFIVMGLAPQFISTKTSQYVNWASLPNEYNRRRDVRAA